MRNRRGFFPTPIGRYYKEAAEKLPAWPMKACHEDMPTIKMKTAFYILKLTRRI